MDTIDTARNKNPLGKVQGIEAIEKILGLIDSIEGNELIKEKLHSAVNALVLVPEVEPFDDFRLAGVVLVEYDFKADKLISSSQTLQLFGIDSPKEPVDFLSLQKQIHPDDITMVTSAVREYFEHTSEYILFECRFASTHGQWNWLEFRGEVTEYASDGSPVKLAGVVCDISRRKLVEKIFQNTVSRFESMGEILEDGVCVIDENYRLSFANKSFCRIMNVQLENIVGRRLESFLSKDNREKMIAALDEVSKGEEYIFSIILDGRNDKARTCRVSLQGIVENDNEFIGAVAFVSDRSSETIIQKELTEGEKKYRALFETAPLAIAFIESDGKMQICNPKFKELVEAKEIKCEDDNFISLLSRENERKALGNIFRKNGYLQNQDFLLRKRDGEEFTASLNIAPLVVSGEPVFLVIAEDITERKTAEQQLKKARDELEIRVAERTAALMRSEKELQERLRELTCLFNIRHEFDGDDRLEDTLRRCAEHIRQAMHNPDRKSVEIEINNVKLLSEGQFMPSNYVLESSLLVDGRTIGWLRVFSYSSESWHQPFEQDLVWGVGITLSSLIEQRELKAQLIHAEKMAASGRVAAGVAHEINNPLGAIKNSLFILQKAIPKNHPDFQYVELMDSEISRVAGIISQLYDLYKPSSQQIHPVDLNLMVENVLKILQSKIKRRRITVETDLDTTLPKINTSLNQITQVLYNIIENAVQAMDAEGGRLMVKSRVKKRLICLSISDTGPGIPEEILPHIFEPFFSTKGVSKASGEGMGIGLSLSRSIMESLGGEISVDTQTSHGTTFVLSFPTR